MNVRYTVFLSSSFQRDLDRIPLAVHNEIIIGLKQLEHNPKGPSPKIKKLKGKSVGQWRLEIWPYRVRYDVTGREVCLYRVRHRRDIYRWQADMMKKSINDIFRGQMYWSFALVNNRLVEIHFRALRGGKKEILGHCYVRPSEYKSAQEKKWIRDDTAKCKFVFRRNKYRRIV